VFSLSIETPRPVTTGLFARHDNQLIHTRYERPGFKTRVGQPVASWQGSRMAGGQLLP